MIVLKWICFSFMVIVNLSSFFKLLKSNDGKERLEVFISMFITLTITFYIFYSKVG